MSNDVNDFLSGGGIPGAKFERIGDLVKGTVTASEVTQQSDFATKKPKFYDDGNPMMQAVITLQTEERDPTVENDTGLRKVYVKGQMKHAFSEALRVAGAKLENGGTLAVQYVSDKPSDKGNPAKQYQAQYRPPAAGANAVNDLLGASESAQQAPPVLAGSDLLS